MPLHKKILTSIISTVLILTSITAPTFANTVSEEQQLQNAINHNEPFIINGQFTKENKKSLVPQEHIALQYLNQLQSNSTFKITTTEEDPQDSQSIIRLQQYIYNIPVYGSNVVVCVDYTGTLTSISGHIENTKNLENFNYRPSITEEESINVAAKELKLEKENINNLKSQLYIYKIGEEYTFAYKIDLQSIVPTIENKTIIIDGYTKEIITQYDNINKVMQSKTVTAQGVFGDDKSIQLTYINGEQNLKNGYYFIDTTRGREPIATFDGKDQFYFQVNLDENSIKNYSKSLSKTDGKFVDAHFYTGKAYDFYLNKFKRYGIDGKGSKATVVANINMPGNAFYTQANDLEILAFGNGNAMYNDSSASIDIVGHEYTHSIVTNTAQLEYLGQSGAIDEAYGDLFGTLLEHSYKSDKNWTIGEDMVKNGNLRSLITPQIDNMREIEVCTDAHNHQGGYCDNNYVHDNSGVIARLGYLIAQEIGEEAMGRIFYNTLTEGLYSQSDFKHLGQVLLTKASTIEEKRAVSKSLVSVGILDKMPVENNVPIEILEGKNRYETSIKISQSGWNQADNVVLVNSTAMVDALSATPFAKLKDAPILLTDKDSLNEDTKKEIIRLKAANIHIIGGVGVVSENVLNQLKSMGLEVERISGDNRYITSLEIAKKLGNISQIALVNGVTGIPDAVSVAPVAATKKMPIVLVSPNEGTKVFDEYIKNNNITTSYIIGKEAAISNEISSKLPNVIRLGGNNRNETNAIIIDKFYQNANLNNIYIAKDGRIKSNDLIDALSIGVLATKQDSPVVIVSTTLDNTQKSVLSAKKPAKITKVGGNGNESAFEELISIY